jgi:MoaA/NifB/PqqE/SkfB family radical SAM enzyme
MIGFLSQFRRRTQWFVDRTTPRKLAQLAVAGASAVAHRETVHAWPAVLKIDVSPICNLRCPVCVHGEADQLPELESQEFRGKRMELDQFRAIIDECRDKVSAVSLYYLGDPFMHPDIDAMCRVAFDAGINVHLSTNFSFKFSDERIAQICENGVTHLTVCVDGFSQDTYGRTRIGGKLAYVLANLERVLEYRRTHERAYPKVEVQYIKFNHNLHQTDEALAYFERIGVDHVETFWGMVNNYVDLAPEKFTVTAPKPAQRVPRCPWPYGAMTIKYDGDVIPCCVYRAKPQYEKGGDPKALGNVFRDGGVEAVWNSKAYRDARRLVADPSSVERDPSLKEHFCYGCPAIFESTYDAQVKMAPDFDVERGAEPHVPLSALSRREVAADPAE